MTVTQWSMRLYEKTSNCIDKNQIRALRNAISANKLRHRKMQSALASVDDGQLIFSPDVLY
ncbi:hypothetical protein [Paraburkholderia sp. ZP32-5]|uniref:hypothetical protein n=1 Tax=Paraburkholderia sp. ZP32-5 TaxID=2883245 RepID=UPI001F3BA9CB|nr:hypothetical protein [Paraburkholderia sp. ZP32-5]